MLRVLFLISVIVTAAAWTPVGARADAGADVRAPLEDYLRGQATAEREYYERAFHPDAELFGMSEGRLVRMTAAQYIERVASGRPAADEAKRQRWIETIDVSGDTAVAKLVLDYPTIRFTDYMSLVKVDGRWVIVNKTYLASPKTK